MSRGIRTPLAHRVQAFRVGDRLTVSAGGRELRVPILAADGEAVEVSALPLGPRRLRVARSALAQRGRVRVGGVVVSLDTEGPRA